MAGIYSFGSQMGGSDDPGSDSLGDLLTYGAKPDDETTGQPNGAPNVKSDASAPIAPAAHVAAVANAPQGTTAPPSQASQAPVYTAPDQAPLQALNAQKAKDEEVSNVSPKWWERALGGLTAGAMAFGKVPGAVEAGQAVTNRGENAAELQRAGRLRADNAGIDAWQDGQKQSQQDFQNRSEAYRTQQEGVRTDQAAASATQQQANNDRNFNRESANDKFTHDRDTSNDSWEQGFKTTTQAETARHDRADEANTSANTRISSMRERRESAKQANDDKLSAPEVRQQQLANQTEDKYRTQVQAIEDGDPKGATPEAVEGFKQTFRKASQSDVNPDTDKPWANPQEKAQYLDDLKQANAERKNSIMQSYAADMNRLGRPTPTVVYDKEGRSITQQPQSPTNNVIPTSAQGTIQKPEPKVGDVVRGYKYNGGDPSNKANWKKV